jgi:hypothetical protein
LVDQERGFTSFSRVVNVITGSDDIVSREGFDKSWVYMLFCCAHCKSKLGKHYKTPNDPYSGLKNTFCFDNNCIATYTFGVTQQIPEDDPLDIMRGDMENILQILLKQKELLEIRTREYEQSEMNHQKQANAITITTNQQY